MARIDLPRRLKGLPQGPARGNGCAVAHPGNPWVSQGDIRVGTPACWRATAAANKIVTARGSGVPFYIPDAKWTVIAFARPNVASTTICGGASNLGGGWRIASDSFLYRIVGSQTTISYTSTAGADHMYAVTGSSAGVEVFVDGASVGSSTTVLQGASNAPGDAWICGDNSVSNRGNCDVYAVAYFPRVLTVGEIQAIYNDPGSLFLAPRRTFFTTDKLSVSSDVTARWSMLSAVEKTQAIRWSLLMATSRDATSAWNMLAAASKSATIRWDMIAALSADATLRWSLVQAVSADATLRWSMLKAVSSDVTLMWDMAGATGTVSRDIAVRWSMLAAVHSDATLHWSMLQVIAREATLSWDMTQAIARDATLRWNMLRAVSANFTAAWNLLQAVSADATLSWDMAAAFGKVSSSVDVRWNMLAAVQKSIDVRWDMLAAVGADAEMRWDMLSAVMSEATTRWDALAATGNEVTVSWDMLSAVENEIAIRWRVGDPSLLSSFVIYTVPRERRTSIIPPELRSLIVPKPQRREALMTT